MNLDMSYFRKILITKCHVCGCMSVSVFLCANKSHMCAFLFGKGWIQVMQMCILWIHIYPVKGNCITCVEQHSCIWYIML